MEAGGYATRHEHEWLYLVSLFSVTKHLYTVSGMQAHTFKEKFQGHFVPSVKSTYSVKGMCSLFLPLRLWSV